MARSHHEILLARGWLPDGPNRYRRDSDQGRISVIKLSSQAGGGWAWRIGDAYAAQRYPSRLSAASAADAAQVTP